jgi:hypothetical protein
MQCVAMAMATAVVCKCGGIVVGGGTIKQLLFMCLFIVSW